MIFFLIYLVIGSLFVFATSPELDKVMEGDSPGTQTLVTLLAILVWPWLVYGLLRDMIEEIKDHT